MNYKLIKESRKALGYTQKQVASSLRISHGAYRNVESGLRGLSSTRLLALSLKLNLKLEDMIMKTLNWEELIAAIKEEGIFTDKEIETMRVCEEDEVKIFCESEVVTVAQDVRKDGESIGYIHIKA